MSSYKINKFKISALKYVFNNLVTSSRFYDVKNIIRHFPGK